MESNSESSPTPSAPSPTPSPPPSPRQAASGQATSENNRATKSNKTFLDQAWDMEEIDHDPNLRRTADGFDAYYGAGFDDFSDNESLLHYGGSGNPNKTSGSCASCFSFAAFLKTKKWSRRQKGVGPQRK